MYMLNKAAMSYSAGRISIRISLKAYWDIRERGECLLPEGRRKSQ